MNLVALLAAGVLATVPFAASASATPASSPEGCWNWAVYTDACYQIVGPGGPYIDDFHGLVGNGHDVSMPAAVTVRGPGGVWSSSDTIPHNSTWYWQDNVQANIRPGTYCATFYSYGLTDLTRCYSVS